VAATSSGGQNGAQQQGGNSAVPPLEEEVDVLSTSTASFRSESNHENGAAPAVVTREAEGCVQVKVVRHANL
jgi:hypothetical protein